LLTQEPQSEVEHHTDMYAQHLQFAKECVLTNKALHDNQRSRGQRKVAGQASW
jgi:hypothetical protein